MESDYYFDDSVAALRFCFELLNSGRADLFRGQVRDWPAIAPSLCRGDGAFKESSALLLKEFIDWCGAVPQMGRYNGNKEQFTAIAQHYGIATRYLDLTTSPYIASIFAAAPSESELGGNAVIYCFSRASLDRLRGFAFHDFDVINLWRLKAQYGVFLEVVDESEIERLRAIAIRVHFPARLIDESEVQSVYPVRKSALETVIDQWLYRHMIGAGLGAISAGIKFQGVIRRKSYPGIARWRRLPEFNIDWINRDPRWVFQDDDRIINSLPGCLYKIQIFEHSSIEQILGNIEIQFFDALGDCDRNSRDADFRVELIGFATQSASASAIVNRCWDGIRVHPYSRASQVRCLARITLALVWALIRPGESWEDVLWGDAIAIDTAPVGGHLDSGMVSKRSLVDSLDSEFHMNLTVYARRQAELDPLYLMNFLVDPWLLFDFEKFSKVFVEEFIPSCVGWYWKSCLEGDGESLGELWGTSFNPALLGFVTLASYRVRSPIATERDVDRIILLSPDTLDDEIEELFISCLPSILRAGDPYTVKFTGYDFDDREVWEIDRVIEQCRQILKIGGVSVLDVLAEKEPESDSGNEPKVVWQEKGLGALHVWAIATGHLAQISGVPFERIEHILNEFVDDLNKSNEVIDGRARRQPDWNEQDVRNGGG